ncbi:uncharacterized protein PGTG_18020 [Puccinia graminis f. sp. tritici CRL 75-36-700-3]|uniref:Uncharacterized protein n=1 Tax=Puccinia graminis f. sp. tritici (strain CRL 75-36-700-3 / race SCCL) TaxID=418459 RepID=E3L5K1_PUCGT|nr:uncharacterized protein PGTG_18020 [Puccinia graminis f. sp. tritici CRL 75-36-700-3]EFP91826.1 hypothetical protein PGTG_18020 [Puccinia graminis f. sp. tritici CRL 75-36-700-3]
MRLRRSCRVQANPIPIQANPIPIPTTPTSPSPPPSPTQTKRKRDLTSPTDSSSFSETSNFSSTERARSKRARSGHSDETDGDTAEQTDEMTTSSDSSESVSEESTPRAAKARGKNATVKKAPAKLQPGHNDETDGESEPDEEANEITPSSDLSEPATEESTPRAAKGKAPAKNPTVKKAAIKKAPAKKPAAKKTLAKKVHSKKRIPEKAPPKQTHPKKARAKKTPLKKAPPKKATAKKAAEKSDNLQEGYTFDASRPIPGLKNYPNAVELTSQFADVSVEEMRSTLSDLGCTNLSSKSKDQLVKLCVAYAPLKSATQDGGHGIDIHPIPGPRGQTDQVTASHSNSDHAHDVSQGHTPIRTQSASGLLTPHSSNVLDDAQFQSDLNRSPCTTTTRARGPPTERSRHQEVQNENRKKTAESTKSLGPTNDADEQMTLGSPNPETDIDQDNNAIPHDPESLITVARTLSRLKNDQDQMMRLLKQQSMQVSALQEDTSNIQQTQRDIAEKLESIWDKIQANGQEKGAEGTCPAPLDRSFGNQCPPSPPSSQEVKRWFRQHDTQTPEALSIPSNGDDYDDSDPHFPYREGPGHPDASPQQLEIMYSMMCAREMYRFRPDLTAGISAPANIFCWEMARDTFLALVEAKEYTGLRPQEINSKLVMQAIKDYAKDRLMRKYREKKLWPKEHQEEQAAKQMRNVRKHNLKQTRSTTAVEIGGLETLLPIIQQCCSDDETDNEILPTLTIAKAQRQKYCKVLQLPWRKKISCKARFLRAKEILLVYADAQRIPQLAQSSPPNLSPLIYMSLTGWKKGVG